MPLSIQIPPTSPNSSLILIDVQSYLNGILEISLYYNDEHLSVTIHKSFCAKGAGSLGVVEVRRLLAGSLGVAGSLDSCCLRLPHPLHLSYRQGALGEEDTSFGIELSTLCSRHTFIMSEPVRSLISTVEGSTRISEPTPCHENSPWVDDLPVDIMLMILDRLSPTRDFIRSGCVCRAWRSLAVKQNYLPSHQIPFLMLSEHDTESSLRHFYNHSEAKVYEIELPDARQMVSRGSSCGWLIMLSPNKDMFLLNPISQARLPLPSLSKFPTFKDGPINENLLFFINRIALSKSNASDISDCIVVAIHSFENKLAFCRPFSETWVTIETSAETWRTIEAYADDDDDDKELYGSFMDITYHKGEFYAVNIWGHVVRCDIGSSDPRAELFAACRPAPTSQHGKNYLVESSGNLLQVLRYYDPPLGTKATVYKTTHFRVFDLNSDSTKWTEIESIGDRSLFLGCNSSMSVLASDLDGCRSNCIYFTDDKLDENVVPLMDPDSGVFPVDDVRVGHDMGIYNLKDKRIEQHYKGLSVSKNSPPLWITPNLW